MSECAEHRGEYGKAACLACLVRYWQSSCQGQKERAEAAEDKLRAVGELPRYDVEIDGDAVYFVPGSQWVDTDDLEALLKEVGEPHRPLCSKCGKDLTGCNFIGCYGLDEKEGA